LKIFYPAFPADAKGLLISAIEDPNPVMFFEHKALYRAISQPVPEGYYNLEPGKAAQLQTGEALSIITYGMGVHWALSYAESHPELSLDILDLRTLQPMDWDSIFASVQRTGKVLVLHEDTLTGGIGAEIASRIQEKCFQWLDAPVMRCASLDTPVPFALGLEKQFLASSKLEQAIQTLLAF
jgi:2-oxoisovalerate dehydrogenase E1 component